MFPVPTLVIYKLWPSRIALILNAAECTTAILFYIL